MNNTAENALIIFARYPEPGVVKTRLRPELSFEEACTFYILMAEDIIKAHSSGAFWHCIVCCYPGEQMDGFRNWLGEGVHLIPQRGEDLGARQLNAFIDSEKLGYSKTVVVGTDCPSITTSDVCTAFNRVGQDRIVLGPADDGGYYLIGSTIPRTELFEKVNWGTGTVFGEVSFNAKRISTDVIKLPGRYDIDRYDDLVRYYQSGRYSVDENRQHKMRGFLESLFGGNSHDR